jgi:hypothetical protein
MMNIHLPYVQPEPRFCAKKSYFFPILGEARAGCSPLDPPLQYMTTNYEIQVVQRLCQSMRMTTEKNIYFFNPPRKIQQRQKSLFLIRYLIKTGYHSQ